MPNPSTLESLEEPTPAPPAVVAELHIVVTADGRLHLTGTETVQQTAKLLHAALGVTLERMAQAPARQPGLVVPAGVVPRLRG